MPYITPLRREYLNSAHDPNMTEGELNFLLTQTCLHYLGAHPRYQHFNAVIGALECCKLELYRRMVAPYENKRIEEHGDVYPEV